MTVIQKGICQLWKMVICRTVAIRKRRKEAPIMRETRKKEAPVL